MDKRTIKNHAVNELDFKNKGEVKMKNERFKETVKDLCNTGLGYPTNRCR